MSGQWAALAGEESQVDLMALSRPSSSRRSAAPTGICRRAWTLLVSVYTTLNFDEPHTELRFREQYEPPPTGRSVAHPFTEAKWLGGPRPARGPPTCDGPLCPTEGRNRILIVTSHTRASTCRQLPLA
jgi:hypothetical protein